MLMLMLKLRLKLLPKFTGASWQHRWVSAWMKGIFRRTMECLKFFSLSSGVVSVSPTMVVLWWARRLEREHRKTSLKQNGPHGLVAHPDSKWWWRKSRVITPLNPRYSAETMAPRTLLECWWQLIQLHMGRTMLNNGRFAFWMEKFRGDLRKKIQQNNQVPPFLDFDWSHHERHCQRDVLVYPLHKGRWFFTAKALSGALLNVWYWVMNAQLGFRGRGFEVHQKICWIKKNPILANNKQ